MLLSLFSLLFCAKAVAGPEHTRDALERLEEVLELRLDEGSLSIDELLPALIVSAKPRYVQSEEWFSVRVIEVLQGALGEEGLRLCEACMVPRTAVENGQFVYQAGPVGLDEVIRLDDQTRGRAQPARTAIWIDEHRGGVSARIIDLRTGRIVFAKNVDPSLIENKNSARIYTMSEELERRARGDSITQAFVDIAIYPGQHISMDWTDQWGKNNNNLSGLTLSLLDPIAGIGAAHYRRVPYANMLVGGKLLVSLPNAIIRGIDPNGNQGNSNIIDPLLTGVGVLRIPFGRSNYGAVATASTNGEFGLGISLMNISLLPVIP